MSGCPAGRGWALRTDDLSERRLPEQDRQSEHAGDLPVARTTRLTDEDAALLGRCGRSSGDVPHLRVVADACGLLPGRSDFLDALADGVQRGGQFLQRRLDEGNVAFRQMVEATGGMAKFDRRRAWFTADRDRFADALG